jgi:hypothetical protein
MKFGGQLAPSPLAAPLALVASTLALAAAALAVASSLFCGFLPAVSLK